MLVSPSHAFSFNIGNRHGRGVSRVQIYHKIITRSIGNLLTGKSLAGELLAAILLAVKLLVTSSGTLTGSGLFEFLSSVFAPNFRQISSITVQTLDTNLVASRRIEGDRRGLTSG